MAADQVPVERNVARNTGGRPGVSGQLRADARARTQARAREVLDELPPMPPPCAGHNGGPPLDEAPRAPGRPSIRSKELDEAIFTGLSDGLSISALCRAPGMPCRSTLHLWRQADPGFDRACRFSVDEGHYNLADQVVGEMERLLDRGVPTDVVRAIFNLRKQQLARMHPQKFGGR
jgi:hypothetical protein